MPKRRYKDPNFGKPKDRKRSKWSGRQPQRGMKGIFITCQKNQERDCSNESIALLSEIIEELYPRKEDAVEIPAEQTSSISDALATELAALREQDTGRSVEERIVQLDIGNTTGIVMLQIVDKEVDPIRVVCEAFDRVQKNGVASTRYCIRMIPVLLVTFASDLESLQKLAPDVIAPKFAAVPAKQTFAIRIHTRKNKQIDRAKTIVALADCVAKARPDITVDLKDPDNVIMLQTVHKVAVLGVFIGRSFEKYKEFNLRVVIDKTLSPEATDSKPSKTEDASDDVTEAASAGSQENATLVSKAGSGEETVPETIGKSAVCSEPSDI